MSIIVDKHGCVWNDTTDNNGEVWNSKPTLLLCPAVLAERGGCECSPYDNKVATVFDVAEAIGKVIYAVEHKVIWASQSMSNHRARTDFYWEYRDAENFKKAYKFASVVIQGSTQGVLYTRVLKRGKFCMESPIYTCNALWTAAAILEGCIIDLNKAHNEEIELHDVNTSDGLHKMVIL